MKYLFLCNVLSSVDTCAQFWLPAIGPEATPKFPGHRVIVKDDRLSSHH